MADKSTLDLGGAEAVSGYVEDIVDAADDPKVAILVTAGTVTGEVSPLDLAPVLLAVAALVSPNAAEHGWPGLADDEFATLTMGDFLAMIVNDCGIDTEERKCRGSRLAGGRARQRCDHMRTGFCLPPGIDDGTLLMADVLVEPYPCLWVNRLPNGAKKPKGGEIVLLGIMVSPLHEGSDGCRGGIENGDAIVSNELPEAVGLWPVRGALVHEAGRSVGQWAIY